MATLFVLLLALSAMSFFVLDRFSQTTPQSRNRRSVVQLMAREEIKK